VFALYCTSAPSGGIAVNRTPVTLLCAPVARTAPTNLGHFVFRNEAGCQEVSQICASGRLTCRGSKCFFTQQLQESASQLYALEDLLLQVEFDECGLKDGLQVPTQFILKLYISVLSLHIVACIAVVMQRPPDGRIYQTRFWATAR
jgi:hypothetical protein